MGAPRRYKDEQLALILEYGMYDEFCAAWEAEGWGTPPTKAAWAKQRQRHKEDTEGSVSSATLAKLAAAEKRWTDGALLSLRNLAKVLEAKKKALAEHDEVQLHKLEEIDHFLELTGLRPPVSNQRPK